jgi:hypothetical protein
MIPLFLQLQHEISHMHLCLVRGLPDSGWFLVDHIMLENSLHAATDSTTKQCRKLQFLYKAQYLVPLADNKMAVVHLSNSWCYNPQDSTDEAGVELVPPDVKLRTLILPMFRVKNMIGNFTVVTTCNIQILFCHDKGLIMLHVLHCSSLAAFWLESEIQNLHMNEYLSLHTFDFIYSTGIVLLRIELVTSFGT